MYECYGWMFIYFFDGNLVIGCVLNCVVVYVCWFVVVMVDVVLFIGLCMFFGVMCMEGWFVDKCR